MSEVTQSPLRLAKRMARLGTETAFEVLVKARALEAKGRDIVHLGREKDKAKVAIGVGRVGEKSERDGDADKTGSNRGAFPVIAPRVGGAGELAKCHERDRGDAGDEHDPAGEYDQGRKRRQPEPRLIRLPDVPQLDPQDELQNREQETHNQEQTGNQSDVFPEDRIVQRGQRRHQSSDRQMRPRRCAMVWRQPAITTKEARSSTLKFPIIVSPSFQRKSA